MKAVSVQWAILLAGLLTAIGCAAPNGDDAQPPLDVTAAPSRIPIRISSDWSTEQQAQILDGLAPWMAITSLQFALTIAPCGSTFAGCIAPVRLDHPILAEAADQEKATAGMGPNDRVVGYAQSNTCVVIWKDVPNLSTVAEHEMGHRLGLNHTSDGGIMAAVQDPSSPDPSISQESRNELAALGEIR